MTRRLELYLQHRVPLLSSFDIISTEHIFSGSSAISLVAMVLLLPPDIILLICEELANQREFGTLFNCAISSRCLAGSALLWMYKYVNCAKHGMSIPLKMHGCSYVNSSQC
jgi:hypothetical protein